MLCLLAQTRFRCFIQRHSHSIQLQNFGNRDNSRNSTGAKYRSPRKKSFPSATSTTTNPRDRTRSPTSENMASSRVYVLQYIFPCTSCWKEIIFRSHSKFCFLSSFVLRYFTVAVFSVSEEANKQTKHVRYWPQQQRFFIGKKNVSLNTIISTSSSSFLHFILSRIKIFFFSNLHFSWSVKSLLVYQHALRQAKRVTVNSKPIAENRSWKQSLSNSFNFA
jgi:hypothetical protein